MDEEEELGIDDDPGQKSTLMEKRRKGFGERERAGVRVTVTLLYNNGKWWKRGENEIMKFEKKKKCVVEWRVSDEILRWDETEWPPTKKSGQLSSNAHATPPFVFLPLPFSLLFGPLSVLTFLNGLFHVHLHPQVRPRSIAHEKKYYYINSYFIFYINI